MVFYKTTLTPLGEKDVKSSVLTLPVWQEWSRSGIRGAKPSCNSEKTKGFGRGQVQHMEYNSFTRWLYLEVSELKYSVTNSFIKEPFPFLRSTPSEDASQARLNNYSAHIPVVLFWVGPSGA